MQTTSCHRRPGSFPGRRFALAAAVACVAAAGAVALPAAAAADQTVVSATIFPGAQGSPSSQQLTRSALNASSTSYQGPTSIAMQSASGTEPPQSISEPAWTLGTIVTQGLQIPEADVTAVQVVRLSGAYETPLSNAQIFDVGQYPGQDGALPTIYVDGGENQTTYVRPPLSGTDANAADNVTQQGDPVSLVVYENQAPLVVSATQSRVAGSQGTTEQVALGAGVTTADGTAVPSSALTFSWTVNAQQFSDPAPIVTFPSGVTPVTVLVYDQATGAGGTATFDVTYNPQASPPTSNTGPGAGNHQQGHPTGTTKLKGGRGLEHAGTNKRARATGPERHPATPSHTSTSTPTTPATTPTTPPTTPATSPALPPAVPPTIQTTTVTTPSPTTTPGLTVVTTPTKLPPRRRTHAPRRRSVAQPGASTRLVTGRLVADVQALPAGASPLVHPIAASAPAPSLVHAAGDGTSAPTWAYAALAVLVLLGGGAAYEWRGRRGRTLHR